MTSPAESGKLYYSIGEVCALTGLEPHVLRFWETEIPQLSPRKSRGGTRRYRREDVELIRRIQHLVHVRRLTLAGARRALQGGRLPEDQRDTIRRELEAILELLG
jgi:DNA-binding transcriptional MerR regulator